MTIYATGMLLDAPESAKPQAVPVGTACKLIGVSNTTMWALIKTGRVKSVNIGRRRLVIYSFVGIITGAWGWGSVMSVLGQLHAASLNQASALIGQRLPCFPAALTKGRRRRAGLKTRHAIPTRCTSLWRRHPGPLVPAGEISGLDILRAAELHERIGRESELQAVGR
jgi:hypothetical protein